MKNAIINIKTDGRLKKEAQKVAKEMGLPLGTIINHQLRELVKLRKIEFTAPLIPNTKTKKLLDELEKDIRDGKNTDGPFRNTGETQHYLDSLKRR